MFYDDMTIYSYVDVTVKHRTGKNYYGDLPYARFNFLTNKWEAVENKRGLAYASRNQLRYRKNKRKNEHLVYK